MSPPSRSQRLFGVCLNEEIGECHLILIWGLPSDPPLAAVRAALDRRSARYFFLNQHAALNTCVELRVADQISGKILCNEELLALQDVSAAYIRPHDSRRLPGVVDSEPESPAFQQAVGVEDALLTWCELTDALIINLPSAMASNGSKPYQSTYARKRGFLTPETLITSDSETANLFWEQHGNVIYKSTSGVRSIVSRLTPDHRTRFEHLSSCPTQFQEHISGLDHRVHVVGDVCFACEVSSEADDYRYAHRQNFPDVNIQACNLDEDVANRCSLLAGDLSLPVAGIDLRRTVDGRWFCFEVNPSPGFTYYENQTAQPIADAIAELLMNGKNSK